MHAPALCYELTLYLVLPTCPAIRCVTCLVKSFCTFPPINRTSWDNSSCNDKEEERKEGVSLRQTDRQTDRQKKRERSCCILWQLDCTATSCITALCYTMLSAQLAEIRGTYTNLPVRVAAIPLQMHTPKCCCLTLFSLAPVWVKHATTPLMVIENTGWTLAGRGYREKYSVHRKHRLGVGWKRLQREIQCTCT